MGVGAGIYMYDAVEKVHVRYLISWWVVVTLTTDKHLSNGLFQENLCKLAPEGKTILGDIMSTRLRLKLKLECGPMPIVMAAQPNIGSVLPSAKVP